MRQLLLRTIAGGLVLALVATVPCWLGCDNPFSKDDDERDPPPTFNRGTPDKLMDFLASAYRDEDITDYEECLHDWFLFNFACRADADAAGLSDDQSWWEKSNDLACTQNMFESEIVYDIQLELNRSVEWTDSDETEGAKEATYDCTLRLYGDFWGDIVILLATYHQVFVVAPDPSNAELWQLYSHSEIVHDCPGGKSAATDATCWGGIKAMFAPPPSLDRATPSRLIDYFAAAYGEQDYARYEESLHSEFLFYFACRADADQAGLPADESWWGKSPDLQSTMAMFESETVGDIELELARITEWADSDSTEGAKVATYDCVLRIHGDFEGDITIKEVTYNQVFVVAPDPTTPHSWQLYSHSEVIPDCPGGKSAASPAETEKRVSTEATSWGGVKAMWK